MSKWRKAVGLITLTILLIGSVVGQAANIQTVFGGTDLKNATSIFTGIGYNVQVINKEAYFKIEIEESGIYNVTLGFAKPNSAYMAPSVFILDPRGDEIQKAEVKANQNTNLKVAMQENTFYYLRLVCHNEEFVFSVSVCSATQHPSGGDFMITKQPSCTEKGEQVSYCEFCGEIAETQEIPSKGHTPGEWKFEKKASCTEEGLETRRCTVCNSVVESKNISMLDHSPSDPITIAEANCTTAGRQDILCTVCGNIIDTTAILPTGHSAGEWTTEKSPTCSDEGLNQQRCTVCNEVLASTALPILAHESGSWVTLREPTCTAEGERMLTCTVCNKTLDTQALPALGHAPGEWFETPAACTMEGWKEKLCTVCGAQLEKETSPALGHAYSEWEVTIEATKSEEGEETRHCIRCGDTQQKTIEKLPKSFLENVFGG